ncbi:MAG: pilus assembly protein [Desulfobulbaceae bacterium]|nr:pilus assembly protein [Desulfobulbaceae bacterium]
MKKIHSQMIISQEGVSAVEFALVLPLLMFIIFGIIEFSILLFDYAVIINASREGARAGIVHVHESYVSDEEIETVVLQYTAGRLINLGSPGEEPAIPLPLSRVNGDLTVTVNYTYDFLIFPDLSALLGSNAFDGDIDITGQTIMRMEDGGVNVP